jgi:7-cyano-7-deazaguanine synthase
MHAVILVSGGLDSATTLAIAKAQGYECHTLSFNYGQRHIAELNAAKKVAAALEVIEHKIIDLDLTQIGGSALTDKTIEVPEAPTEGIPITYVPARNTIFLSYALAWAEVLNVNDIFIGINAVDYSGYPDCRPEYIKSYTAMANLATKAGVEGSKLTIHTPLINLSKAEIIKRGIELGVDYSLTVSCYQADQEFEATNIQDPTNYQ